MEFPLERGYVQHHSSTFILTYIGKYENLFTIEGGRVDSCFYISITNSSPNHLKGHLPFLFIFITIGSLTQASTPLTYPYPL